MFKVSRKLIVKVLIAFLFVSGFALSSSIFFDEENDSNNTPSTTSEEESDTKEVLGENLAQSVEAKVRRRFIIRIPTRMPTLTPTPKPTVLPTVQPTIQPRQTSVALGLVIDDYMNATGAVTSLETKLSTTFSTISIYKQFGHPYNNFLIPSDLSYIKSSGKNLTIAWEPWNPSEGLNQQKDYLYEIASGQQDSYINQFAQGVKNYGKQVTIRFGHEMNGNWYPWAGRAEDYKKAYRFIVDRFRQLGVTNVSWMWCINETNVPYEGMSASTRYYPGDAYVDVIGIDGYNFGTSQSWSTWKSFDQIFWGPYNFLASSFNKPIVIAEVASSEQGGDKSQWITQMFNDLTSKYPRVTEVVWFDLIKESDWRIDSTASSTKAFTSSIAY